MKVKKRRRFRPLFLIPILILLLFAATLFFRINKITIYGASLFSPDEILKTAGIHYGDNLLWLNEEEIAAHINSNRYLTYTGIWRDLPGHLLLYIEENHPHAYVSYMGRTLWLDKDCIVLEDDLSGNAVTLDIPQILGAEIISAVQGKKVLFKSETQEKTLQEILTGLDDYGLDLKMSVIDLTDSNNLLLYTVENMQIQLGNNENIPGKIRLIAGVYNTSAEIEGLSLSGGRLDVSGGKWADFLPAQ